MKTKILEMLKNSEEYVSGQEICDSLNVSRTAIWKIMNKLREDGYIIEAVKNKGYKLCETPDILSKSEIESSFATSKIASDYEIVYLDEIDSTNNYAKLIAEQGAKDLTLVVSDCQTKGKGRRGRSFESPKGVGIFMTYLLKPDIPPIKASMLTIIAATAVRMGIHKSTGLDCKIKWPNDIVSNGKKVCGILTEMSAEMEGINYVVVGIGINVNNEAFPAEIANVATSIKIEVDSMRNKDDILTMDNKSSKNKSVTQDNCVSQDIIGFVQRSKVIAAVTEAFDKYYREFVKCQDLSCIRADYDKYLINAGEKVKIVKGDESYEAIAKGIADTGELIIERNGNIEKVMSGEVSVRGVYGYV